MAITTFFPYGSMSILRFPPSYGYSFSPTRTTPATRAADAIRAALPKARSVKASSCVLYQALAR